MEKVKLSDREPVPRREACQRGLPEKLVTADEEERGEVRREFQIRPHSTSETIACTNEHKSSAGSRFKDKYAFLRGAGVCPMVLGGGLRYLAPPIRPWTMEQQAYSKDNISYLSNAEGVSAPDWSPQPPWG